MARLSRSGGRNVRLYGANNPTTELGGLFLTNGITNANFYSMVEIIILFESEFFLRDEGDTIIKRDNHPLQPGKYYIVATDFYQLTDESWLVRTESLATGTRIQAFCDAVRSRDRRCVVSGEVVPIFDGEPYYSGFQAAHIFPLAYEGHWKTYGYGSWITLPPRRGGTINSVQNGILLEDAVHHKFDNYDFSINPDDNYKIVFFMPDSKNLAGKHLDQEFLNNPQRSVDQLLRWHFRQAVIANMKGAGEPIFEHDFPPGSDMVGDILRGPKAGERMEFELFSRLGAQVELFAAEGRVGITA
jgi:hypothetical protein